MNDKGTRNKQQCHRVVNPVALSNQQSFTSDNIQVLSMESQMLLYEAGDKEHICMIQGSQINSLSLQITFKCLAWNLRCCSMKLAIKK